MPLHSIRCKTIILVAVIKNSFGESGSELGNTPDITSMGLGTGILLCGRQRAVSVFARKLSWRRLRLPAVEFIRRPLGRVIIYQLEGCGSRFQRAACNSKPPGDKLEKYPWL